MALGNLHFKLLEGRKSTALEDMYDEPIVITLRTGEVYAGLVDDCYYNGGWVVALYSCKLLDKKEHRWIDHNIFGTLEGRKIRDPLPDFWVGDMKCVEVLSEALQDKVDFEDALQLYNDPHYKPVPHVKCNWNYNNSEGPHGDDCESRLHEALSFLVAQSVQSLSLSKEDQESLEDKIEQSIRLIRRRLRMTGARIP